MDNQHFTVIGGGNIGDKARQLIDKTPTLTELGFHVPHRTVLAQDFFDGFFEHNELGRNLLEVNPQEYKHEWKSLEDAIILGGVPEPMWGTFKQLVGNNKGPLMARSSAAGDARGTGIYKSHVADSNLDSIADNVLRVLASYFSEDAISFRRDAQTGEGFGIIVEPLIGNRLKLGIITPLLSGFGYTSTLKGEGYVTLVPGLFGGVNTKDGEKITESAIKDDGGSLRSYIRRNGRRLFDEERVSALIRPNLEGYVYLSAAQQASGSVQRASINLDGEMKKTFYDLNLNRLFEMMEKMEFAFKNPQYFEFAMTVEKSEPNYWITQIADVNKKADFMDFENLGDVIFEAHTVTGTGIRECYKIANCNKPEDIYRLHEFNKKNKGYVLLFSSRLTTTGLLLEKQLSYADFSNASVFLEIPYAPHVNSEPVAHLGGQLEMTGKLFGVLDYHSGLPPQWDKFNMKYENVEGMATYNGKVKVIASERQDRMIVSALD